MMVAVSEQLESGKTCTQLVGGLDDPKLRSCVRLFERVSRNGVDDEVHDVSVRTLTALKESPDATPLEALDGVPTKAATDALFDDAPTTETDAPIDAATDAPIDAATDAPIDAATDAPMDTADDEPAQAVTDVPLQAADGDTPIDAADGDTPIDAADGDTPIDAADGDTPIDAADGAAVDAASVLPVKEVGDAPVEVAEAAATEAPN
jgi:hypothetical protein